jgi:hydroxypyruvate isomerase
LPRFAANISTLYPEHPLLARIGAAARDGFAAVEVQAPYAVDATEFRRALAESRMKLVLMNAPQGNVDAGERGLAAVAGQERRFESTIAQALDYARTVGTRRIHVMAGRPLGGVDPAESARVYLRNLAYACDELRPHGISVTIEPINTRDMPGYFLTLPQQAAEVIVALLKDNLALQFDCYHAQIMVGDLARHLERHFPIVGHVQIAGVPDRHEPDAGEIKYSFLFGLLDLLGYSGWVGCEYRPARGSEPGGTSAGLGWLRRV